MVVFKGMGIESDIDVCRLIGTEEPVLNALPDCLEECHRLGVATVDDARKSVVVWFGSFMVV